jgi:DNA-binding response OmpR family regulator
MDEQAHEDRAENAAMRFDILVCPLHREPPETSSDSMSLEYGSTLERTMPQQTHVLILTNERAMQNLFEQLFIIYGAKTVIAETGQAAKAIIAQMGLTTFSLIVIDTAALEACELYRQHMACQLLQDWTAEHSDIPLLFIGTVLQKHAILAIRADTVMFLVKPFQLDEVVDAVRALWPGKKFPPSPLAFGKDLAECSHDSFSCVSRKKRDRAME